MIEKKARANALKYWLIPCGVMLLSVIAAVLTVIFWDAYIGFLLLLVGCALLPRFLWHRMYVRYITKPYQQGEIELFCKTVEAIGMDARHNHEYALALDEQGRTEELVSVCTAQIKRLKGKKRNVYRILRYHYLFLLTRHYFRAGDNEKTAQLCAVYREWLQHEKAAFAHRIDANYSDVFSIYETYLAGDADGCLAILQKDPLSSGRVGICSDMLIKARVKARLQGDIAGALALYAEIEDMLPACQMRESAGREAENLRQGRPYGYGVPEILPDENFVLQADPKSKRRRCLFRLYAVLLLLLWIVPLLLSFPIWTDAGEQDTYSDVIESIQDEYPDVKVLGIFEQDEIDQYVYVGRADDMLVVGTFYYEGFMDMYFYVVREDAISTALLKSEYPCTAKVSFLDSSGNYLLFGSFYNRKEQIPALSTYTEFVLDDTTCYFALDSIADMHWLYLGDELVESTYVRVMQDAVTVGYTFVNNHAPDKTHTQEVKTVSAAVLADPAQPLLPMLHTNVTGEYAITGCFYRSESEIPASACEYYEFTLQGKTYYYAVLSVEPNHMAMPLRKGNAFAPW